MSELQLRSVWEESEEERKMYCVLEQKEWGRRRFLAWCFPGIQKDLAKQYSDDDGSVVLPRLMSGDENLLQHI